MKKTLLIVASILAPIALQAEPAEGKTKGPKGERKGPPAEILAKFDKDGDGKLNEEERKAAGEARKALRAEILAKHDTDGDGKLSPKERQASMIARFDKDGDGKLSEAERMEAQKEFMGRRGGRGSRNKSGGRGVDRAEGKGKRPKGKKGPREGKTADGE